VGQTISAVMTGESSQVATRAHEQALAGLTVAFDIRWSDRVYQGVVKPLRDARSQVIGVLGMALDVTERHQAQEALRQAHAELETRVQQRTADLVASNKQLQQQIAERRKAEDALAASRHQLLEVIDGAPAVIYAKDLEGRYILANCRYEALFSISRQDIVGKIDAHIFPPAIAAAFRANDQLVMQSKAAIVVEERAPHADGMHTYVSVKFPLFDLEGRIYAVCGISTDITTRIDAENALRESEEKYRVLVNNAPAIILNVSPQGQIVYLSRPLAQMLPEQAVGRHVLDLVHPDQRKQMESALTQAMQQRQPSELEVARFGGMSQDTWHALRIGPILREDGEVLGFTIIATDITDRRRTEQELRMIRSAVQNVQDAVVITDAQIDRPGPVILYVNAAFCRMTGYEAQEVIGRSPRILQGPRSDRAMLDAVRMAMREARPFRGEVTNYRKDGSEFLVNWEMAPVFNASGRLTNWIATQRDITQWRRQEEQAAIRQAELAHVMRLSTMGEMASGLAHELNQPLAAIANFARGSLMRLRSEGYTSPRVLDAIEQIAGQAERAGQIIRRMRNFIRKREPRRSTVNINDLVHEAVEMIAVETRQSSVRVGKDLAENLPQLLVDHIQIEQVILNLLRNSVEAMTQTPPAQRELVVSTRLNGNQVLVEVRDNGRGLGGDVNTIFDPFFTTKPEGMGIGLTISRSIIDAHGGRMWATENPICGCTFHFTLPTRDDGGPPPS
jgi:PAS domain S-box-containing protein